MAIDIQKEKECVFNPQMIYNATANAIADAYDDGFLNSYIMQRAIYCHLYIQLEYVDDDERRVEEEQLVNDNPLSYWMDHIDTIDQMIEQHAEDIKYVRPAFEEWFEDYTTYAYSMRGMLDNMSDIMNGVTQKAEAQLETMYEDGELDSVKQIADKWGLSNDNPEALAAPNDTPIIGLA